MSNKGRLYCFNGCNIEWKAVCVQYNGTNLTNLGINTQDDLKTALEEMNDTIDITRTPFVATSTNSIIAISGGTIGHSPKYYVRINPSDTNILSVTDNGLYIDQNGSSDGKVKVDESDDKDYLEDQFGEVSDDDNIITVTPEKVSGAIKFTPSISVDNLISVIESDYQDEFCSIISDCIARKTSS
jgi:hypothetical protein